MSENISQDVFNRDEALENVGGMEDLLLELGQTLIDELPKLLLNAHQAIAAGDAKGVNAALHSLKGAVTPFAAKRAHAAAWQLEQSAAAGDLSQAAGMMSRLESELDDLKVALGSLQA